MIMKKTYNKVFNIGLNRSGTTSLNSALTILGFKPLHFQYNQIRLYDIAINNLRLKRRTFYELDQQYNAFLDFAPYNFFHILDQQYPQSKFILTIRDLESWLDSRERKVKANLEREDYKYYFTQVDRENWTKLREQFVSNVTKYFHNRSKDFLIINIPAGEGWEKLCPFLDVSIPDLPFPHQNQLLIS